MASSNIANSSPPSTPGLGASDEIDPSLRINALLVALAALTHSFQGDVLDVLPHLSRHTPSSVCLANGSCSTPSLRSSSSTSIVSQPPSRWKRPQTASASTSPRHRRPAPATAAPSPELCAGVETQLGLVRDIARGRTPLSTKSPNPEKDNTDDAEVMGLSHTQLTVAVLRGWHGALPLEVLLRKFESCETTMPVVGLATMRTERDAHAEALERMYKHLEALLQLTDIEDAMEIKDERHFVALHVAGRFAARALRDEGFRVSLLREEGD